MITPYHKHNIGCLPYIGVFLYSAYKAKLAASPLGFTTQTASSPLAGNSRCVSLVLEEVEENKVPHWAPPRILPFHKCQWAVDPDLLNKMISGDQLAEE